MSNEDLILEHKETLETVANADCSASWIAKELLESFNIQTTTEPEKTLESPTEPTEKQPEGSVFAY